MRLACTFAYYERHLHKFLSQWDLNLSNEKKNYKRQISNESEQTMYVHYKRKVYEYITVQ